MVSSKEQSDSDTIYFDTACYNHTSSNCNHFYTMEKVVGSIKPWSDGPTIPIESKGSVLLKRNTSGKSFC
jgi:hypothetical protein